MFKVAIIGGEGTENYEKFRTKCINILKNKAKEGITIYTTGDNYVDQFAKRYNINVRTFYTNWNRYGKNALKYRNEELLKDCDALIAFNDGIKDTRIIYSMAVQKGIPNRSIA